MNNSLGIYLHIPFCDGKCYYCDFFSGKHSLDDIRRYADSLFGRFEYWSKKAGERFVDSVYFGGGTPSLLGTERLIKILDSLKRLFRFQNPEITLEINPTSCNMLDFAALHSAGFNRLSVGLQSSADSELRLLGRRHCAADAARTVEQAKKGGFKNISLDLMLGIPEQTEESLTRSLEFAISQEIQHISCYMLTLERGTPLFLNREKYRLCSDEEYARLYELTCNKLKKNGFSHYEISNFCKPGFESRHNLKYWQLCEYIGIGPSAHSYFEGKRFYCERSFESFYRNEYRYDCDGGGYEEFVMLALRLEKGLIFKDFEKKYGFGVPNTVLDKAKILESHKLLNLTDEKISLTEKGFLLSNEIIVQLLECF